MLYDQNDTEYLSRVDRAAHTFVARRDRREHPDGSEEGTARRWYPSDREFCECCKSIRNPSRAWPWSLMIHCRTAEHVAHLFDVDASDVRRRARQIDAENRVAGGAK